MAIPVPRSYNQTLGEMIDAFLSRLGLEEMPVGDPLLSVMEAASQSDVRDSQDIFEMLSSIALARANGIALDRIGSDENAPRLSESPASGFVRITDTSFDKLSSTIYQGKSAPIIGSDKIYVVDATSWTGTGSVYVGRGTDHSEGPLAYTSLTDNGGYWTIQLAGGNNTQKFHNLGDPVILAQGGNRLISAGTVTQTPQGNIGDAAQFSLLYNATIPDGEVEIVDVRVVCKKPGTTGNVAAGGIKEFVSEPFTGATVTNDTAYTNGQPTEDDDTYRDRIRDIRQSRSKATPLAIKTGVIGAIATDENKRIVSASVVTREGYPTTLYIDDGSGYEEIYEGIPYETIVDSAQGGEQYFTLVNGRPVTKAFAKTAFQPPYNISSGSKLSVKVGGVVYEHVFTTNDFLSISNSTAYEIVASINANPDLKFDANTTGNGTGVILFADNDVNEDIEVIEPDTSFVNANLVLGFPSGKTDTLRLYKNDVLLNKDGTLAAIQSNVQANWASMSSGETIQIVIDGVNISGISDTYTITDADFVNAGTIYATVSSTNSLDSWASVLNFKIPGITVTAGAGFLTITSNRGRSSSAKVDIQGGSLVTSKNMFPADTIVGTNKDYTFNRNLGLIRLEDNQVLVAGDKLTAGSLSTRAFVQSSSINIVNIATTDAELWFCVDGDAEIIKTGIQIGSQVDYSATGTAYGSRVRATFTNAVFTNAAVGDWLIVTDSALLSDLGCFRIIRKDAGNTWIEIERATGYVASGTSTLAENGFKIVRSTTIPQKVVVPVANNYTALTFVQTLNSQLVGATAVTYKTVKIRVYTDTFDLDGDIALVAVNTNGAKLLLPTGSAIDNLTSHLASIVANNSQAGTPSFNTQAITAVTSTSEITESNMSTLNSGEFIVATRPADDTIGRFSNFGFVSPIEVISSTVKMRNPVLEAWLPTDFNYHAHPYALNAQDNMVALIDQNVLNKRYTFNTYRKVKSTSNSYTITPTFTDADNGNISLAQGFGTDFNWRDFAVWMKARAKSHLSTNLNTTKTVLWRYSRWGPEGNNARIQYRYPSQANQSLALDSDILGDDYVGIKVLLPSNAARTGTTIRTSSKIGVAATSVSSSLYTYYYVLGFAISSASRTSNVTTATLTLPGPITDHGLQVGDQIYITSTSGSFSSGVKIITARSTTTVNYVEVAADVGATANIGSLSFDNAGEVTLTGSTVIAGDIFGVIDGTSIPSPFAPNATKIGTLDAGGRYFVSTSDQAGSISTVLTWGQVNDLSSIAFYPLNAGASTATLITTAINNIDISPVSATVVGGGSGVVAYATYEIAPNGLGATDPWYYFEDGINYIRDHNTPATPSNNFVFTFKDSISTILAADDSDWVNEDVRLAPVTAKNVVDFFNSTAVSGLVSSAEVIVSKDGQKPQISSLTVGSSGSVQVQSGSANTLTAVVKASGIAVGATRSSAGFTTSDIAGLSGRMWVALDNTNVTPKVGRITSATTLSILDTNGNFTLSGTNAWDYATTAPGILSVSWQVVKQGNFVQIRALSGTIAGVVEGDVCIFKTVSPGSTANDGTFKVIRVEGTTTFWIENSNAVEEIIAVAHAAFLDYTSILPGDTLSINTTLWGANNVGDKVVSTIDLPSSVPALAPFNGTGSQFKFKVDAVTTAVTGPVTLGASSPLVQVIEAQPYRSIKQVYSISPDLTSDTLSNVKFSTQEGYDKISTGAATILTALDKLAFPIDVSSGIDGYKHSLGLIEEANKILYGVESDTGTYPGLVAAGAKVNTSGSLIKRVLISLAVSLKSNISLASVQARIQSEVASVVNKTPAGKSIAIGDIVAAAQAVNGVDAVAVLSPTYNSTNYLIPVQPFERPLVLNASTDITVSLIGE